MSHRPDEQMSDRLLNVGEGLIIGFPSYQAQDGPTDLQNLGSTRAYFLTVSRVAELHIEYTQLPSLSNGQTLNFDYLGDTGHGSGEDIFRV
jgi:hypothetical protein